MSRWRECKIGDVVLTANTGLDAIKRAPIVDRDTGIKCLRIQDVSQEKKYEDWGFTEVETRNFDKFQLKKNDIIIARTGASIGVNKIIKEDLSSVLNNGLIRIRANEALCDSKYLFFNFRTSNYKAFIESISGGTSTQPNMQINALLSYEISLPSLHEQEAIAAVLSSFDDKIDLLHRQNKTLEAIAETLFKQWFIVEAKEDWEFVELGNYVNCFNGVSYKSTDLNSSNKAMVTLKNFDRNGGFRLDGFKEYTGQYKKQHVVVQGDLVVAHTDITQDAEVIGNPILVVADRNYDEIVISMDLVKVTSKYDWLSNEFLYRMMRTREFKQHCLGYSNGSTVLHLSKEAIPSYEFFLPPEKKLSEYTIQAKSVLNKKFKNIAQIKALETLRDTLLPKLMSGEVRVNLQELSA